MSDSLWSALGFWSFIFGVAMSGERHRFQVCVSTFSRENLPDRHGFSVQLSPRTPVPNGFIIQSVKGYIESMQDDGKYELDSIALTEAWEMKHSTRGKDAFLVPLDWRVRQDGSLRLETKLWFSSSLDSRLHCQPNQVSHFGTLAGTLEYLEPPPYAAVTTREVIILWTNIDKSASRTHQDYRNGKDLFIFWNKVFTA